jgi:acetolactate synthase regulatory subunit
MNTRIAISIRDERGALVRTISTIERRGFHVRAVSGTAGRLECDVHGDGREPLVLLRHLRKLEDVDDVRLLVS